MYFSIIFIFLATSITLVSSQIGLCKTPFVTDTDLPDPVQGQRIGNYNGLYYNIAGDSILGLEPNQFVIYKPSIQNLSLPGYKLIAESAPSLALIRLNASFIANGHGIAITPILANAVFDVETFYFGCADALKYAPVDCDIHASASYPNVATEDYLRDPFQFKASSVDNTPMKLVKLGNRDYGYIHFKGLKSLTLYVYSRAPGLLGTDRDVFLTIDNFEHCNYNISTSS